MIKKISLLMISALLFTACSDSKTIVDDAVNNAASGDVTSETIKTKEKVLIVKEVSVTACVVLKNELLKDETYKDADTLIANIDVTCATYGKSSNGTLLYDTECIEQSFNEWIAEDPSRENIENIELAKGDRACVIGADIK